MELTIRKVLPEEAEEYTICHVSCWQSAYRDIIPNDFLDNMYSTERVERCKQSLSESDDFYCAEVNGKMIGRLVYGKSRDIDKPNAGEVVAIYLTEPFWNKGYGKKMMDYAVTALKDLGCNEVVTWVLEDNKRARNFNERYGFIADGTKKEMEWGKALTIIRYTFNM